VPLPQIEGPERVTSTYHDEMRKRREKTKEKWEASLPGKVNPQELVFSTTVGGGPAQGIFGGACHVQGNHSGAGGVFRHPEVYPRFSSEDSEWRQFANSTFASGKSDPNFQWRNMYVNEGKRLPDHALERQSRWPENQLTDQGEHGEVSALGDPRQHPDMRSPGSHRGAWKGPARKDLWTDQPTEVMTAWNRAGRYPFLLDQGEQVVDRAGLSPVGKG